MANVEAMLAIAVDARVFQTYLVHKSAYNQKEVSHSDFITFLLDTTMRVMSIGA